MASNTVTLSDGTVVDIGDIDMPALPQQATQPPPLIGLGRFFEQSNKEPGFGFKDGAIQRDVEPDPFDPTGLRSIPGHEIPFNPEANLMAMKVLGAGVGSAFAPQVTLPALGRAAVPATGRAADLFSQLPFVRVPFEMASAGLKGLKAAATQAPRVIGAGAGGALGGAVAGPPAGIPAGEAALQGGLEMAAAETVGIAVWPVLSRLASPGKKKLTELGGKARDFAIKHDLNIAPDFVTKSKLAGTIQKTLELLLPGSFNIKTRLATMANVIKVPIDEVNKLFSAVMKKEGFITGEVMQQSIQRVRQGVASLAGKKFANQFGETLSKRTQSVLQSLSNQALKDDDFVKILFDAGNINAITLPSAGLSGALFEGLPNFGFMEANTLGGTAVAAGLALGIWNMTTSMMRSRGIMNHWLTKGLLPTKTLEELARQVAGTPARAAAAEFTGLEFGI